MTPVTEFTIKRSKWLRGEKDDSALLRERDRKQCCLGIYLEACGAPLELMNGVPTPSDLADCDVPEWLVREESDFDWDAEPVTRTVDSDLTDRLVAVNDSPDLADPDREAAIAARFQEVGITVRFED